MPQNPFIFDYYRPEEGEKQPEKWLKMRKSEVSLTKKPE